MSQNLNDSKAFDVKELERIAKACRKAGIKTFKGFGMEFTLTEDLPQSAYKQAKAAKGPKTESNVGSDMIESDSLTDEALLLWSVQDGPTSDEQAGS